MEIIIQIENSEIKMLLREGKKVAAEILLKEERKLGEELLPLVDGLIRKNRLTVEDIKKIRVTSDQADTFTTTRIAKTFAKTWNYGREA